MSSIEVTKAIKHLQANPRDKEGLNRLKNALYMNPAEQVCASAPGRHQALLSMIWRAAGFIVSRWDDEQQRWQWICTASGLVKIIEKPKTLPKAKRAVRSGDNGIDLKKRAAGDE